MIKRKIKYILICIGFLLLLLLATSTDITRLMMAISNGDFSVMLQVLFRYGIYLIGTLAAAKLFYCRKERKKPHILTLIIIGICLLGVTVYSITVFYPVLAYYIPVQYWQNFFIWPNRWSNVQLLLYLFARCAMYGVTAITVPLVIDHVIKNRQSS